MFPTLFSVLASIAFADAGTGADFSRTQHEQFQREREAAERAAHEREAREAADRVDRDHLALMELEHAVQDAVSQGSEVELAAALAAREAEVARQEAAHASAERARREAEERAAAGVEHHGHGDWR